MLKISSARPRMEQESRPNCNLDKYGARLQSRQKIMDAKPQPREKPIQTAFETKLKSYHNWDKTNVFKETRPIIS